MILDRDAMGDLLGLPMVLAMIRLLWNEARERGQTPPSFQNLSELYLITARKLLDRVLDPERTDGSGIYCLIHNWSIQSFCCSNWSTR